MIASPPVMMQSQSDHLSADRILTTHVGSLPRDEKVVDLLLKRDSGESFDAGEFDRSMTAAVSQTVRRQVATGIDLVSDGETAKVGYATYIKERLSGFGGHTERQIALDLKDYPEFRAKMALVAGTQSFQRQSCIGPIEVKERASLRKDLENLRAAVNAHGARAAFVDSASPGVVSAFQTNRYYPSHQAYVEAIANAMQEEYETIAAAGFTLQLDCPDLAMARHTGFQDLSEVQFLERAQLHVEVLNHAVRNIPAESMRMHVCWGNYEGPHDHDIALEKIIGIILKAKPAAILFEASNPRHAHEWIAWRDAHVPDNKILVPGLLMSTSNYVEHPELIAQRIAQFASIVGRERVIAGTDCGFGSFAGVGRIDPAIVYRKLAALVEGAALASRRLWK
jgi:5-methyltetrahydropteroyltriglutamate--homocysteine methyltransferase